MAKAINTRERMDSEGERCMQRCAVLIEKNVEAKDITGFLYSKFVLTLDEKTEIENEKTQLSRIRLLTSQIISHGGIHAFSAFLEALKDAHYDNIRTKLCQAVQPVGKLPDIVHLKASTTEKFNNEWARRKTSESKMSFLCTKVKKMEETITQKPKQDPSLMKAILDIKKLLEESTENTKVITGLTRQLEDKDIKLKLAAEKIKDLEEKIRILNEEKEFDRTKITQLETKVESLEENDKDKEQQLRQKGEEIAELQDRQTHCEEELEEIKNAMKKTKAEERTKPVKNPKPSKFSPRHRFLKKIDIFITKTTNSGIPRQNPNISSGNKTIMAAWCLLVMVLCCRSKTVV